MFNTSGISLPLAAVLVGSSMALAPVVQAANGTGIYGSWSFSSSTTGSLNMGGVIPNATLSITGGTGSAPTGSSIFLGPSTPVGAEYGTSQNRSYASIGLGSSFTVPGTPAITTIQFATATPSSGWSFALGDVDAEDITITAQGPNGALDVSSWWRSSFNYCNVSPKPSGCPSGTSTDVPRWVTPTLQGNKVDTGGAAAWFTPNVQVTSLTFSQARNVAGGPSFQLWIISDTVLTPEPTPQPTPGETTSPEEPVTDPSGPAEPVEPTAPNEPVIVRPGQPVEIPILDVVGAPEGSTLTDVTPPSNGTVRVQGDIVVYTPAPGFYGSDTFEATITDRSGTTSSVVIPLQVGLVQRPVKPPKLAKKVTRGTTVVLGGPVRTNAKQIARATVTCSAKQRIVYRGGGEPLCVVSRSKGAVQVRVTGAQPVTVRVVLEAPARGQYGPYRQVKRYLVR